jgi:aldehyde:ferredoxin oxidoreductase
MENTGYRGKMLRVDLTNRVAYQEVLPSEVVREFIGGAGTGIKYLFDRVKAGIDPLSPENQIMFSVGPFTGTSIPCASRMAVIGKSPLTNTVGVSLSGGFFPEEMKKAGYDLMIFEGKAEEPTYVVIKDEEVRFRNADALWGTQTTDCQQIIKDELHDQNLRIACIGPAGENLCRIACVINERRAAGRKGLGAIMGSKNLKAIAVRGSGSSFVASKEKLRPALKERTKAMKESPVLFPFFSKYGTSRGVNNHSAKGIFPARNWTATGEFMPVDRIGVEARQSRKIGQSRCAGCPVGCGQLTLARTGIYAGILSEGPEYETMYSFGGQTGVDNLDSIIASDRLSDELGLDTMSTGVAIGFAMELFERGILTTRDTEGLELRFGRHEAMFELVRKIAFRQGFGDLLADGVRIAALKIGKGSEKYAMHVKGLELPAYDVRGAYAHGLNYATSYTGADHNRGYAIQEIFGATVPYPVDRFGTEGKGELTKWNQDARAAVCDSPTMCAFIFDMALAPIALRNTAALMEAVTGFTFTPDDVLHVGERINNVARAFNVREGFGRAEDTLPERIMTEPLREGASKGHLISKEDLHVMLDEYYHARGWDLENGIPTRRKLTELGLEQVADELEL